MFFFCFGNMKTIFNFFSISFASMTLGFNIKTSDRRTLTVPARSEILSLIQLNWLICGSLIQNRISHWWSFTNMESFYKYGCVYAPSGCSEVCLKGYSLEPCFSETCNFFSFVAGLGFCDDQNFKVCLKLLSKMFFSQRIIVQ